MIPRSPIDFSDLDYLPPAGSTSSGDTGEGDADFYNRPKRDDRPKFPCQSCGGTGRYRGLRVHQEKAHCFACKGLGYFRTSPHDRAQAKVAAAARKQRTIDAGKDSVTSQHPDLIKGLRDIAGWHQFAASLVQQLDQRGSLTDNQIQAAYRAVAKVTERNAQRATASAAKSGEVDVTTIRTMFDRASGSGLKQPSFVADGIILSLAGPQSRNPGAIYVQVGEDYAGKIVGSRFMAVASAPDGTIDRLQTIAADPKGEAVKYGRLTGRCACCSRLLTDPVSVANGIGPICEGRWF